MSDMDRRDGHGDASDLLNGPLTMKTAPGSRGGKAE
jgi:hypothetical protein